MKTDPMFFEKYNEFIRQFFPDHRNPHWRIFHIGIVDDEGLYVEKNEYLGVIVVMQTYRATCPYTVRFRWFGIPEHNVIQYAVGQAWACARCLGYKRMIYLGKTETVFDRRRSKSLRGAGMVESKPGFWQICTEDYIEPDLDAPLVKGFVDEHTAFEGLDRDSDFAGKHNRNTTRSPERLSPGNESDARLPGGNARDNEQGTIRFYADDDKGWRERYSGKVIKGRADENH